MIATQTLLPSPIVPGADPDNMAPSTSNCGGFDTLEVSIYGQFSQVFKNQLYRRLEVARDHAQHEREDEATIVLPNGRAVRVERSGMGRGRAHLPFRVECEGVVIGLGTLNAPADSRIASVHIGSLNLMRYGHREAWARALELLEDLGVNVARSVVSRADLCVDLPGVPVDEFVELFATGYRVARARKGGTYIDGRKRTGFDLGVSGCRIRVYDKLLEMTGSEATAKFCVLRDVRWGGVVPTHATRVEYQLRRDFLRETLNIETVEQLFEQVADMVEVLCHDWFRMTKDLPDHENNNQTKARDAECWAAVVEGFRAWTGQVVYRLTRRPAPLPDNTALERQLVGVAETLVAITPKFARNDAEILSVIRSAFLRVTSARRPNDSTAHRIARKRARLASGGVLTWLQEQQAINELDAWQTHEATCFCDLCIGRAVGA